MEATTNVTLSAKEFNDLAAKAKAYDELEEKIAAFYNEDDEDGGDLCDIGAVAAEFFGFY